MFLDLDHFKRINDTLGHSAGDLLLRIVGGRLRDVVRGTDTVARDDGTNRGSVARLGGDEFILFLTDLRRAEDAARVAARMLEVLQAPVHLDAGEVYVSASIGIGLFPQDGANIEELLKNADAALYHAKDAGRNNYQFYTPSMNAAAFQRLALEGNLRRGSSATSSSCTTSRKSPRARAGWSASKPSPGGATPISASSCPASSSRSPRRAA